MAIVTDFDQCFVKVSKSKEATKQVLSTLGFINMSESFEWEAPEYLVFIKGNAFFGDECPAGLRRVYFKDGKFYDDVADLEEKKKTVVFTGGMFIGRDTLKQIAENAGFTVTGSVNKNTDLLVYGWNPTSKLKKAKELGIDTMTTSEFFAKYGSQDKDSEIKVVEITIEPVSVKFPDQKEESKSMENEHIITKENAWRRPGETVEFYAHPDLNSPKDCVISHWKEGDQLFVIGYRKIWTKVLPVVQNLRTKHCTQVAVECLRKIETAEEKQEREEYANGMALYELHGSNVFNSQHHPIKWGSLSEGAKKAWITTAKQVGFKANTEQSA